MRVCHTTCPGSSLLHKETKPGFSVPHFADIVTMQQIKAVLFLALVVATGANLLRSVASHNQTVIPCTLNKKSAGAAKWKGKCHTLDACRSNCQNTAGCVAFNWWPGKGGCRHLTSVTSESETEWTTVGGAPDCTVAMVGPTDSICPNAQTPQAAWCSTGIQNPKNRQEVCCAMSCGKCGGRKCGDREGGKEKCCHDTITKEGGTCTARDQTGCLVPVSQ
jgi:hypothetical protein